MERESKNVSNLPKNTHDFSLENVLLWGRSHGAAVRYLPYQSKLDILQSTRF